MNKKQLVTSGLVALAVSLVGTFVVPRTVVTPVVERVVKELGSVTGPELSFPNWTVNGIRRHYYVSGLNQASTTVCSFKTPAATTTLESASIKLTTSTTTALVWDIAKSNTPSATTTKFGTTFKQTAGEKVTLHASTTGAGSKFVIAPSNYVNFKYGNVVSGGTNVLVGSCRVILTEN